MALTVSRPIARSGARSSIRGSLAVRAASASSPSSRPGAIAPPTYAPSAATQSSVVAVPKSTTTAGVPCSRAAARALTSRSAPTSPGRSTRTASGTVPAAAISSGRSRRSAMASTAPVSAGTTEASAIGVEVGDGDPVEPQQPVEQQLDLVGRGPRVRRGAARREQRAGPEQADGDVRVADVEGEQHRVDDTRPAVRTRDGRAATRGSSAAARCCTIAASPSAHRGDAGCRARPPPSSSSITAS